MKVLPTQYQHRKRARPIRCFLLHSTGNTDEKSVCHYYQTNAGGVTPHRLILRDGEVCRFVDIDRVAYHTGLSAAQVEAYRAGRAVWTLRTKGSSEELQVLDVPFSGYEEWLQRWPDAASPLDLLSGDAPNGNSIGIELLAEAGQCTDAQYDSLAKEIQELAKSENIPLDRTTLLGHYDATPLTRCNRHGGTDPGPHFDWRRLYSALGV